MIYHVSEIFYTLQGEGFSVGTPAVFVRLAGCNLRCPFCDTEFDTFVEMTEQQICAAIDSYLPRGLVVFTGGEPLLQLDECLLAAIHAGGHQIAVETNGTRDLPKGKEKIDWVTCSPKVGASLRLTEADELKIVFTHVSDAPQFEQWRQEVKAHHYFLQPCALPDGTSNQQDVLNYVLNHPQWRLSLQTQKILNIR